MIVLCGIATLYAFFVFDWCQIFDLSESGFDFRLLVSQNKHGIE